MTNPRARTQDVLYRHVGTEMVVYDRNRHRAHRLDRIAAAVWSRSDGETDIRELSAHLEAEFDLPDGEEAVRAALGELSEAGLLEEPLAGPEAADAVSRRDALRRVAAGGAAAVALPMVTSILAPTPAMAATKAVSPIDKKCKLPEECPQ